MTQMGGGISCLFGRLIFRFVSISGDAMGYVLRFPAYIIFMK